MRNVFFIGPCFTFHVLYLFSPDLFILVWNGPNSIIIVGEEDVYFISLGETSYYHKKLRNYKQVYIARNQSLRKKLDGTEASSAGQLLRTQ